MSATAAADRASELGGRIAIAMVVTFVFVLDGRMLTPLGRRVLDPPGAAEP